MNSSASKLSPLQLELLKVYSFNPTDAELKELKNLLAQFFANRFTDKVAQAAMESSITEADLDNWLEEDEQ